MRADLLLCFNKNIIEGEDLASEIKCICTPITADLDSWSYDGGDFV